MVPRRFVLPYFVALLAVGVTACAPTPTPAPTPTASGFASEDEAFAAAEETYRAYVAETNAYHAGVAGADPLRFLTGELKRTNSELLDEMRELGVRIEGETSVVSVTPLSAEIVAQSAVVTIEVCLDETDRRVLDADGDDVTPAAAPDRYPAEVELTTVDRDRLVILRHAADPDGAC
ncbi:hypothetical protein ACOKGD_02845 [Microbacterium phosphatis]|uniref:hypothetical protein n=1 Tax=Microbacterium phosphatis TaxID=3140248 RepID=UPI0031406E11